jgi:hypothetical protein
MKIIIIYFFFLLPSLVLCQANPQEVARQTAKDFIKAINSTNSLKQSFIEGFGVQSKDQFGILEVGNAILDREIDIKKMNDYITKKKQVNKLNELLRDKIIFKVPLIFESRIVSYLSVSVDDSFVGRVIEVINTLIDGCDYLQNYAKVEIDGKIYIVDTGASYFNSALTLRINRIQNSNDYISYDENKFEKIDGKLIIEYIAQKLLKKYSLKELETLSDGSSVN